MQVHASTQSKAWKRGADKKIATVLKVGCDLRDMTGSLHLDAMNAADVAILTAMYKHVFSQYGETKGAIAVFDKAGKELIRYQFAEPAAEAK
jgi:hypothetical protein